MDSNVTILYGGWLVRSWAPFEDVIAKGALAVRDGRIQRVGDYDELTRAYPNARLIGDNDLILIPGFVNAHSHGRGLTTFQQGYADEPLELRILRISSRATCACAEHQRPTDWYTDTLYSCFKQIATGITTTVHSSSYVQGSLVEYASETRGFLDAYRDSKLRCSYAVGIRDRSTLFFVDDPEFVASLPSDVRSKPEVALSSEIRFDEYVDLVAELASSYEDLTFQYGPWNPAFCSEALLEQLSERSRAENRRVHTHLAETQYQAMTALRRYGVSWATYLHGIGLLSPRFSGAHCIWLDEADVEKLKASGAQVVHNPASNLRLQSGTAQIRAFLAAGVVTAVGVDSLGLNDDEDVFQNLRLARVVQQGRLRLGAELIPARSLLDMATRAGALVAGFYDVGTLEVGKRADVVALSRSEIEGVETPHPISAILVMRGKPAHIKAVFIGGELVYSDRGWHGPDPKGLLRRLGADRRPPKRTDVELRDALIRYLEGSSASSSSLSNSRDGQ